ncbi:MAG: T9SS type A sorting domain-containing protein [Bacillota bacterium]
MRVKNSILFFVIMFMSSRLFGQIQITFDDQGWNPDQSLSSGFTIGTTSFSSNKPFFTNYGYNLNVDNTGIYFVFQNPVDDQLRITKTDNKSFNLKSLAAYQVSEAGLGSLIIEGWNGSTKLYTSTFSNVKTWQNLTLNYKNVTRVIMRLDGTAADSLADYNFDNFVFDNSLTSVENTQVTDYNLDQNYPNPFNPSTLINYQIPQGSMVTVKVYDSIGNEVCTLVNEYQEAGRHSLVFNAENLSSGIYIYKLSTNGYTSSKKMTLVK